MLWMLLVGFAVMILVLFLVNWLWISQNQRNLKFHQEILDKMMEAYLQDTKRLQEEKRDLLNRLMSKDLQAFTVMTASTQSSPTQFNDNYISPHDEAELARLKNFAGMQGLGEPLNFEGDEEVHGVLTDLGFDMKPPTEDVTDAR